MYGVHYIPIVKKQAALIHLKTKFKYIIYYHKGGQHISDGHVRFSMRQWVS